MKRRRTASPPAAAMAAATPPAGGAAAALGTGAAALSRPDKLAHKEVEEGGAIALDFTKLAKAAACGVPVLPCCVQHVDTKEVLIIAYQNEGAFRKTLDTGVATFWSTSRRELWVKGATSGDTIDLAEARVNCEQNSTLLLVRPRRGGVCHTKHATGQSRSTCYYRRIAPGGKLRFALPADQEAKTRVAVAPGKPTFTLVDYPTDAAALSRPAGMVHKEVEEGGAVAMDFAKLAKAAACGVPVLPCCVQDADTKEVLIVAYQNEEALRRTLDTGIATFWSTSRNELWVKGATSGDTLDLVEARVNCEQNSVLILVRPRRKGACHTKHANGETRRTCYYRRVAPAARLRFALPADLPAAGAGGAAEGRPSVTLVDYGAGNVRSVVNAIRHLGWEVVMARTPEDIAAANKLVFPGVGAFGACMEQLARLGFADPLRKHIAAGKPFFGICLGMQTLFEASEESPGVAGLGVIPGTVTRFRVRPGYSVPHMGWNGIRVWKGDSQVLDAAAAARRYYFVHSYLADAAMVPAHWVLSTTDYGGQRFVSSVQRGACIATQFHPEKSSHGGLELLRRFLTAGPGGAPDGGALWGRIEQPPTTLAKRVIACLDVRTNDQGDVVVTKGDQYDVREKGEGHAVRNLGRPVDLAERYYKEGADEITFLNITSFRNSPLGDQPMLEVLRQASERIFVPLCVGGGIRPFTDPDGKEHSALDVAGLYFRSGADKVSLGGDAVEAALEYRAKGAGGGSSVEQISRVYGRQAVVISVDPKRVYVADGAACAMHTFTALEPGPAGQTKCWYQCTVKGGRETRELGAYELAQATEALGAGEVLLNCIDKDGTNSGYDTALVRDVKGAVGIPVIASSGAGRVEHFADVVRAANPDAVLAAGIFHRREVGIDDVKAHLRDQNIAVRDPPPPGPRAAASRL